MHTAHTTPNHKNGEQNRGEKMHTVEIKEKTITYNKRERKGKEGI